MSAFIEDHDEGDEQGPGRSMALRDAIRLRELTRIALAKWNAGLDTHDETCRLNALADKAYDRLDSCDAMAYMAWAREVS